MAEAFGWVKRVESVNVRETVLPLAQPWSILDSLEGGICSFGVTGSGMKFPEFGRERQGDYASSRCPICHFGGASTASPSPVSGLENIFQPGILCPFVYLVWVHVTPGDPRHILSLASGERQLLLTDIKFLILKKFLYMPCPSFLMNLPLSTPI